MSDELGYRDVERSGLDKLLRRTGHSVKAYCVVTTEDDLVLVRKKSDGDKQGLLVRTVMIDDPSRLEESIREHEYFPRLRNAGSVATSQITHVEFLSSYRFVPPSHTELALPFAVEIDAPSDSLDLNTNKFEWVNFDWLDTFLTENEAPKFSSLPDAHHALRRYLDTMTTEEVAATNQ
jgi:hypothetical protein